MRSVIPVVVLSGCVFGSEPTTPTVTCTEMAFSSVSVQIVDEAGDPLEGATVVYSLDGAPAEPCEDFGGGGFACGWEQVGSFEILATMTDRVEATTTVVVSETADGCHVDTQFVELSLVPLCDDPPPALLVTVLRPDLSPAVGESVAWGNPYTDGLPQPCDEQGDGSWACAYGVVGPVQLYTEPAEGDPFQSVIEQFDVPAGQCGPETIAHTVTFQYLPD